MRWKKLLTATILLAVVLIITTYVILLNYDFNRFKPRLAQWVKNATGRELTIAGDIEFALGIRPNLIVEDVSFQNASWSSTPALAQVKRMEVQIAVLPLLIGKFDFAHLVLIEPAVMVEFDRSGTSNFTFDPTTGEEQKTEIPPPPLIFSDVLIEKGHFTYRDAQSDFKFTIRIDHLTAEIPGFDKSLQLDFKGAFDDIPFTLNGTVGPIWAWVEAGYALPADITVAAGSATARVKGEMRDPTHFKELSFTIAADGPSTADIAKLVGVTGIPELGAIKLAAAVSDPEGPLAIDGLSIHIGSEELVAISITGAVKNLLDLQGIKLDFAAQGREVANLTQLGIPPPPKRGNFAITADISDPAAKMFSASDLKIILGENEFSGQINLDLAQQIPTLTASLLSSKFEFGLLNLDLKITGPLEKPAIEKLDLKLGTPELAQIRIDGVVKDLMALQGVDINFQAGGQDLAVLMQVIGQPVPIRGAFSAAGKVLIPVQQNLKIPNLKITAGKNNITGSLNLDLRGDQPQLEAKLSLPQLDLPSVLLPELAGQGWARGLSQVRPVKLAVTLAGLAREIALKKVDLRAGTLNSAEVRLAGSVANLVDQRGFDLNFSLQGNEMAKLKEITAQPYLFVPVPGQGAYALSGHVSDPTADVFEVDDFKLVVADTELAGRLSFNLADPSPVYEVEMSGPKFSLRPFPIPKEAAYANLNKIDDLGPLKIHSKLIVKGDRLSLPHLDLRAGSEQLAAVEVKGSIKNLTEQNGIDLSFNIRGNEVANLTKITGQSIPLKGTYVLSGTLTDPAQKNYKVSDLNLKLGENNITGSIDLNLSAKQLQLAADLAAPKFTLQPVAIHAMEPLTNIEDLGPLKLSVNIAGSGKKFALETMNLNLGNEKLIEVILKGTVKDLLVPQGIELDFAVRGNEMANFKKLGVPEVAFKGAFNVSGRLTDPAPKIYKIPSLKASWGNSESSGWIELDLSKKRPQLRTKLSSGKFDLRPFLAANNNENAVNVQASKPGLKKDKVFSGEPFHLEGLQVVDADVKLRDISVLLPSLALNDVMADILLNNGNLQIKPAKFMIGGGKAEGWLDLSSQDTPSFLSVALEINQLAIGPMLEQLGYKRNVEGNLDVDVKLEGAGDSMADLMAGLNGETFMAMSDGKADSKYLIQLQKYLGSDVLQLLNPFKAKVEYAKINCFINRMDIKDGRADIKLLLDTRQTSILGAGDVNLKTEKLNLGIKPTPKKGHGLSGVGTISFSLKNLSQPFRLGGTLAKPSLIVDPSRTAFAIGKFAGALALGPVGIAAFFSDVSVGKKDPCPGAMKALQKKPEIKEETESKKK